MNSPLIKDIPSLSGDDNYKYLGIIQADSILHDKVKENTKKEYYGRVRSILKKGVSAKNTTSAIKTFAMPILRYGYGVIKWTQNELRAIDCKTRKILYKYKFHHPKSDIHRLYLTRKLGGRGLIGAMDCYRQEHTKMATYIEQNTLEDPLVESVRRAEEKKTYGIMAYRTGQPNARTTKGIDMAFINGLSHI